MVSRKQNVGPVMKQVNNELAVYVYNKNVEFCYQVTETITENGVFRIKKTSSGCMTQYVMTYCNVTEGELCKLINTNMKKPRDFTCTKNSHDCFGKRVETIRFRKDNQRSIPSRYVGVYYFYC